LIVSVNDRLVSSVDDLHQLLSRLPADQPISLSVLRGAKLREIQVQPALGQ
jgi:S1-C subfamily serine protease